MSNFTKTYLSAVIFLTAISFAVKAQTNVSGGIYSNATWTKANSPYIVTDAVVLFPGVTLTIEAGVVVKFDDNMYLSISSASLIAEGTPLDSITFTSNSSSPTPGIWNGLEFYQDSLIILSYCNIFYGEANGGYANTFRVRNSTFKFNSEIGLNHFEYNNDTDFVDSCVFQFNADGLATRSGIINCYASNNNGGEGGEYGGTGLIEFGLRPVINCVSDSNNTGINGGDSIINCICNNNSQLGIFTDGETVVQNCTANSNATGISASNSYNAGIITGCQIEYNGTGISDSMVNNTAETITKCVIENNDIGLNISSASDTIFCNKICNNYFYDLYFDGSTASHTTVANNYWCSTDSATISSYIYDGYNNVNFGLVSFLPVDSVGCYLTGCDLSISATVTNATCDTCHNGQATAIVSYGHPNYTYTWYTAPIQSTQTATGLAAGTYTVCVTDGNGCSACNYSVFVDSTNCNGFAVTANATNASCTACADGKISISIMNGAPPYTYNWIPFGSGPGIDSTLTTGFYQICVADLYGCVACDTATVGVGACSAYFNLYPDTVAHQYTAVNNAFGAGALTYVWNWGDGSANDSTAYPSHTYAVAGFYTICLTITDTAGCTNTYCNSFYLLRTTNTMIHVNVVAPVVTGVKDVSSSATMYIFPNPASNYFTLFVPENNINGRLRIYNLLGELIYTSTIAKQETNIDVSALAKGIYVLEVSNGDNLSREKFIRE